MTDDQAAAADDRRGTRRSRPDGDGLAPPRARRPSGVDSARAPGAIPASSRGENAAAWTSEPPDGFLLNGHEGGFGSAARLAPPSSSSSSSSSSSFREYPVPRHKLILGEPPARPAARDVVGAQLQRLLGGGAHKGRRRGRRVVAGRSAPARSRRGHRGSLDLVPRVPDPGYPIGDPGDSPGSTRRCPC